jgi:hypothetical protein
MTEHQVRSGSNSISIAGHILPVSATMVGVCMTVISLVQIIPKNNVSSWVDALLAVDNLLFLSSAAFSYYSIRHPVVVERFERRADVIFMLALFLMVFAGLIVAFDLFIE